MSKEVTKAVNAAVKNLKKEIKKIHGRTKFFFEIKVVSTEVQLHEKPDVTVAAFKKANGVKRLPKK